MELFELPYVPPLEPRYNIAPTQPVAAVRYDIDTGERKLDLLKWGLIPFWAKDAGIGNRMINARSETVAEKPAFRAAFRERRCLVPADGFYEWQKLGTRKQPHHIHLPGGGGFGIAGLWESWESGEGDTVESCTLLTTEANETLKPIHHRMPVILDPSDYDVWLDPKLTDRDTLEHLLRAMPEDALVASPVSTLVNSPGNQGPELIAPIDG
jgi:putative SOS response-associated peptidase YedK